MWTENTFDPNVVPCFQAPKDYLEADFSAIARGALDFKLKLGPVSDTTEGEGEAPRSEWDKIL